MWWRNLRSMRWWKWKLNFFLWWRTALRAFLICFIKALWNFLICFFAFFAAGFPTLWNFMKLLRLPLRSPNLAELAVRVVAGAEVVPAAAGAAARRRRLKTRRRRLWK